MIDDQRLMACTMFQLQQRINVVIFLDVLSEVGRGGGHYYPLESLTESYILLIPFLQTCSPGGAGTLTSINARNPRYQLSITDMSCVDKHVGGTSQHIQKPVSGQAPSLLACRGHTPRSRPGNASHAYPYIPSLTSFHCANSGPG